jgi:hypothetical protein
VLTASGAATCFCVGYQRHNKELCRRYHRFKPSPRVTMVKFPVSFDNVMGWPNDASHPINFHPASLLLAAGRAGRKLKWCYHRVVFSL